MASAGLLTHKSSIHTLRSRWRLCDLLRLDVLHDGLVLATRSCGVLMLWRTRIAERTGFLIMPKRSFEWRVDSHCCHKFNNADLALGPRDTTVHFPFFYICAPPTSQALTVPRAANKPRRGAWNAKPPSMNVDNAVGNSPNLRHPDVLVPPLRENTEGAVFLWWPLLW